jgi:hypothetical protein
MVMGSQQHFQPKVRGGTAEGSAGGRWLGSWLIVVMCPEPVLVTGKMMWGAEYLKVSAGHKLSGDGMQCRETH